MKFPIKSSSQKNAKPHWIPQVLPLFNRWQAVIFLGTGLILTSRAAEVATFQGLGDFPGGAASESKAYGVSADGSVVVGYGTSTNGKEAFRWTANNSIMTALGDFPDNNGTFYSTATGVSANGSVVVGEGIHANGNKEAFRWTNNVMTALGDLDDGNFDSKAFGVSADGSVIVGRGNNLNFQTEAFRWANNVMMPLGNLTGGGLTITANSVSADGSVIVGYGLDANNYLEAFRGTNNVMTPLGYLPGAVTTDSKATGVSADGSVVVGYSHNSLGPGIPEAFRWTNNVMTGLGDLPGGVFDSEATGVSADGSIVVGFGSSINGNEAFRWDSTHGMQSLGNLLTTAGVDLSGWNLEQATAISADGKTIVGYGIHNGNIEAWIASYVPSAPLSVSVSMPTILISGKKKVTTAKPKLVIKGKTTGIVTKVIYRIGKRAFKVAKGTSSWKFKARLKPGKNKITVIAIGPGGSSKPAKVVVTRK